MGNRICQNCKNPFTIEPEDFAFYEKMDVPPPTFCPECRLKRRMMFRNEMNLYKRTCDASGKIVFSGYSPQAKVKVYDRDIWYSDQWDPMEYGREYDFSRPFFTQFKELFERVPLPARNALRAVDSDYCNNISDLRRCYLLFNSELSEDSAYGDGITSCREVYDSYFVKNVERAYEGFVSISSYNVFFSSDISDSHDIYFSKDLTGCSYCFACCGLRNKHYSIFNTQYSKEEYVEKLKSLDIGSYANAEELRKKAQEFYLKFPVKFMHGYHNVNVSGDYITNSRNVHHSFLVDKIEDSKYCYSMGLTPTKDSYDFCWGGASELAYEAASVGYQISHARFVWECWPGCFDITYCIFCSSGCSHLFGCVGLRAKQYCILNTQYSKEEYEKLIPRIIQQMNEMPYTDLRGNIYKFGEFFPTELSPFAYNETIAQEYFPLTEETAHAKKYQWREPEERKYEVSMRAGDLPDHIRDATDKILKEIIGCEHAGKCKEQCTSAFRITLTEFEFYRKINIPLPRLCPNCRHYARIAQRNPLKLWKRKCMCAGEKSQNGIYANQSSHFHGSTQCPDEFETSYSPERQEIVYCERCYQEEVV
ncbi:MAG: Uncharacterized protein G01um101433_825 [Parcubacteria group bacterium Gr01-1014_33]|nr:MAG: Uncharacterized protein G01um101433_825 [Parcubacteria group bacterium Gr01-1014_33]